MKNRIQKDLTRICPPDRRTPSGGIASLLRSGILALSGADASAKARAARFVLTGTIVFALTGAAAISLPPDAAFGEPSYSLAGAGSDADDGTKQKKEAADEGSQSGDSSGSGSAPAPGTFTGSGSEILPDDEMLTVMGSHSTLTNELVAGEYDWVKRELEGRFMPYVISHAEGNPNVIHFLYLYGHDVTSPESFTYTDEERESCLPLLGEDVKGLVPLLMQWDWRWGFDHYGGGPGGLTGCAPTCMAMIGLGLTGDESINPRDMFVYSENAGFWVPGQGTSWSLVTNAFPNHPIACYQINPDEGSIRYELEAGHPVLINVGVGKFSAVGHFMVLAGIAQDGTFILNDPNNLENCSRTWPWSELSSEVVSAWSYYLAQ